MIEQFDTARATFERLITSFPASQLAPGAMLRIGRSFEEQKKFDEARAEYRRLIARYPNSEAEPRRGFAARGRFLPGASIPGGRSRIRGKLARMRINRRIAICAITGALARSRN